MLSVQNLGQNKQAVTILSLLLGVNTRVNQNKGSVGIVGICVVISIEEELKQKLDEKRESFHKWHNSIR